TLTPAVWVTPIALKNENTYIWISATHKTTTYEDYLQFGLHLNLCSLGYTSEVSALFLSVIWYAHSPFHSVSLPSR
ncbi:hypothetical protein P3549_20835, partial [Vibrio parahaemolyticus]|nr:hypothetical protein [Vibrio parahaemolyticus]